MSEDKTRNLTADDKLDLILQRLDQVDARLDRMEARQEQMDSRLAALEAKSYDTRPIWERALAEILELKSETSEIRERVEHFDHKLDILNENFFDLRAEQRALEKRMLLLERISQNPPAA